jgi:hypothetical protein
MEKSTAAQKLKKYEGAVTIALRRAEDAKAVLVEMGVDVEQFDGVELLSAGPSPTVSPSKLDGRVELLSAGRVELMSAGTSAEASSLKLASLMMGQIKRQPARAQPAETPKSDPGRVEPKSLFTMRMIASIGKTMPPISTEIPSGSIPSGELRQLNAQFTALVNKWEMSFLFLDGPERLQEIIWLFCARTSDEHELGLPLDRIDGLAARVFNGSAPRDETQSNIVAAAIAFTNRCDGLVDVTLSAWAPLNSPLANVLGNARVEDEAGKLACTSSGKFHLSSIVYALARRLKLEAKPTVFTMDQLFEAQDIFAATVMELSQGQKAAVMAYRAEYSTLEQRFKLGKIPFNFDVQLKQHLLKALPPGALRKEVEEYVKLLRLTDTVIEPDDFFRKVEALASTIDQEIAQKKRAGSDRGGAAALDAKVQPARAQANAVALVADTRICWLCQQPGHIKPNCPFLAVQGNGQAPQRARGSGL